VSAKQVLLSWSGGKDSSLALAVLRADPGVDVVGLLTSVTTEYDRISIHGVRHSLLAAQAEAVGLPLLEIPLAPACTNDAYEAAFHAALVKARQRFPDCRTLAFGDLFLEDVRVYRERLLSGTEYEASFPLWGRDTAALAREFIERGFRAYLVCVDTTQLDGGFAGRAFDPALLRELPSSVDPCGERGEFHTFVWRAPVFDREISVAIGESVLRDGRFAYRDLVAAEP
jgi:uncharacterized protein (TIGR00290 family)